MRQQAVIVLLAMGASGLVVAGSWDLPGIGTATPKAAAAHKAAPAAPRETVARTAAPADVDLTVTFHGQPAAGHEMHASVSAPEGSGIVSWALDEAPAWLRLEQSGTGATLGGTVPADAEGVSFTVAATDAAGRTFYAGSGDMLFAGEVQAMTSGPAIGSAMALPAPKDAPAR